MNKLNITAIAAAIALAFSAGAMATGMSKDDYKSAKDSIAAEFKPVRSGCDSFSANAKDVCMAEANGKEKVARAVLEAKYKPSKDASYKVRVAKAEADYAVAKEQCDDKAGNVKDVCIKEAKAAETAAKADAKAQMKTADANQKAAETSAAARNKANEKSADARKDAASDKRDADYAVAKEKCDAFAGDAKSNCISEAKARFGRS